jgi:hypothetical protein
VTHAPAPERLEAGYRNLERVNRWIANADVKAAALLTAEAILLGLGIGTLPSQVAVVARGGLSLQGVAALAFLGAIVPFGYSFMKMLDVFVPEVQEREESIFYFGSIARLSRVEFEARMKNLDGSAIEAELARQTHINASIAAGKFANLRLSARALTWSLGLILVFLILKGYASP